MDACATAPNCWGFRMEQTWHAHVFSLDNFDALAPCNAQIMEIRYYGRCGSAGCRVFVDAASGERISGVIACRRLCIDQADRCEPPFQHKLGTCSHLIAHCCEPLTFSQRKEEVAGTGFDNSGGESFIDIRSGQPEKP